MINLHSTIQDFYAILRATVNNFEFAIKYTRIEKCRKIVVSLLMRFNYGRFIGKDIQAGNEISAKIAKSFDEAN